VSILRTRLAGAVAAAGGLVDFQADAGSVFIYRRVRANSPRNSGSTARKWTAPTVPIVYSVSFADPAGYFLTKRHFCR
jgi:polysaccharide biosynthesis/export protein